jgi:hypothetical protein
MQPEQANKERRFAMSPRITRMNANERDCLNEESCSASLEKAVWKLLFSRHVILSEAKDL